MPIEHQMESSGYRVPAGRLRQVSLSTQDSVGPSIDNRTLAVGADSLSLSPERSSGASDGLASGIHATEQPRRRAAERYSRVPGALRAEIVERS
jgi:hypothetical protein